MLLSVRLQCFNSGHSLGVLVVLFCLLALVWGLVLVVSASPANYNPCFVSTSALRVAGSMKRGIICCRLFEKKKVSASDCGRF